MCAHSSLIVLQIRNTMHHNVWTIINKLHSQTHTSESVNETSESVNGCNLMLGRNKIQQGYTILRANFAHFITALQ